MPEVGRQTILKVGALLFAWGLILVLFAGALGYVSASGEPRPAFIMALTAETLDVARVEADYRPPDEAPPPADQGEAEAPDATGPDPSVPEPNAEIAATEITVMPAQPAPASDRAEQQAEAAPPENAAPEAEVAEGPATEGSVSTVEPSGTEAQVAAAQPSAEAESQVAALPEQAAPGPAPAKAETEAASLTLAVEPEDSDPAQPAWRRHGEKVDTPAGLPRIAVVIAGLGLSAASTEAAIQQLPARVTLSFTPYSRRLQHWISRARAKSHEVLLDLPMEPSSFPNDDPGPKALLTGLSEAENQERLDWILGRGQAAVGVAAAMGSRFTASDAHMLPVITTLNERGLLYLDNRSTNRSVVELLSRHTNLPYVAANRILDSDQASRIAINARLAEVERLAVENGFATAIGQPYPVTIERVRDWSAGLAARGFALVPITALVGAGRPPQLSAEQ